MFTLMETHIIYLSTVKRMVYQFWCLSFSSKEFLNLIFNFPRYVAIIDVVEVIKGSSSSCM